MSPSIETIAGHAGKSLKEMKGVVLTMKRGRSIAGGQEVVVGYVKVPLGRHKVVVREDQQDAGLCLTFTNGADVYESVEQLKQVQTEDYK